MKRYTVFAALLMMIFTPLLARAQSPSVKIAYIDLQKVMIESDKGKEARKSLSDRARETEERAEPETG